jgi:AbrB family looped-hinge helix DNA binding protein
MMTESQTLELGENGAIVLPKLIKEQLNLHPGDRLVLTLQSDGTLQIATQQTQIRKLRGLFRDIVPGVSLSEELIRDRRQEARQANR